MRCRGLGGSPNQSEDFWRREALKDVARIKTWIYNSRSFFSLTKHISSFKDLSLNLMEAIFRKQFVTFWLTMMWNLTDSICRFRPRFYSILLGKKVSEFSALMDQLSVSKKVGTRSCQGLSIHIHIGEGKKYIFGAYLVLHSMKY